MLDSTKRIILALCLTALSPWALFAQGENGAIVGTVVDASGAAVTGTTIMIKNNETGATITLTTSEAGQYASPPLRPGSYTVSAEKQGFRRTLQTISLDVNQHARVNFDLAVGSVAESTTVTGEAPLLESQSAALGNVRTTRAINDLPLNGRNFVQLFHIATGVIPVGGGPTLGPSASNQVGVMGGSVNGARPSNNDFRFDGIQSQDTDQNVLVLIPSADAIQEFKVQTSAMDASFGRNGGATVNLVMKSGTNDLHGTLFEFLRNSALDAKNFFDAPEGKTPPFKLNQFGGSLGGPVRRDRTFFFGDYQGTRIRQAQTYLSTVPTEALRRGDFSPYLELERPLQIFDPLTTRDNPNFDPSRPESANNPRYLRDAFPGNIIPGQRFNATGRRMADLYPRPNRPGLVNNFLFNPVRQADTNQFDVRIDHRVGDFGNLFGRYSFSKLRAF